MALEDLTGNKFIDALDSANPVGATDFVSTTDDHLRGIKNVLKKTFPNLDGACNMTDTELNLLVGLLATAAELNILNGATLTTAELDKLAGLATTAAELAFVAGVTSAIQSQIDGKAPTAHAHTAGEISDLDASDTTTGIFDEARVAAHTGDVTGLIALTIAAGAVNQGKLAANSVGQSEIKNATQTETFNVTSGGGNTDFTATGGRFTLGADGKISSAAQNAQMNYKIGGSAFSGLSAVAHVNLGGSTDSGSKTATGRWTYVNTSRPYDMGDGEAGLFIYMMMDIGGIPITISLAEDPPWANNGPTRIAPNAVDANGNKVLLVREEINLPPKANRRAWIEARANTPFVEVSINQARKNADINIVPKQVHNIFDSNGLDITNQFTQILLDPVSNLSHELLALYQDGEIDEVLDILQNFLIIDNTPAGRVSPAGILVPAFRWK